jgi:NAD(P)-dependent dehydrogenase (short-subunit alcohol dehydrogenase family)
MVNRALEAYGAIHILVNECGIFSPTDFFDLTCRLDKTPVINGEGMFPQRVAKLAIAAGTGDHQHILNLAKIRSKNIHLASKAAVIQLMRACASSATIRSQ